MSPDPSTTDTPTPRKRLFADISPLKESPAVARLLVGFSISGIGSQMTIVAVGLNVYELTHSTFAVSLVGAFVLFPLIFFGIWGGVLADRFDRRRVLLVAASVGWFATIGLALLAWFQVEVVWPLYLLSVLTAVSATVSGTVRFSILPRLLPARLLPATAALGGIGFGLSVTVGPALAGVLVAAFGFGVTYSVDVVLFLAAFAGIVSLPSVIPEGGGERGWASITSGIRFLRTAPNVRMSFLVDIIAMTFGRPQVLFPAVGALVIGGGPVTVGILTAAGAIGALASSVFSGRLEHVRRYGAAIGWSIAVYGACILGFGVVLAVTGAGNTASAAAGAVSAAWASVNLPALALASLFMAGSGASDNISSIFRQTMLQTAAPDQMRGRLQGIFTVVVTGGPRVGDLYIGLGVAASSLWFPPLLGGAIIIVLVGSLVRFTAFRRYDSLEPTP